MAKALSSLPVGALVKDNGTLYYGKPIIWRVVDKNHSGYPANSVTLMTDKIITLKCFDAKESGNSDSNRRSYGNNRYIHSNIRQWLNSQAEAGAWYVPQHSADAPPNSKNVSGGYNEYDAEVGFLYGFSTSMRNSLLVTSLTVAKNAVIDGGYSETCLDKIFLASTTEVGLANENGIAEGSRLAAFDLTNASRFAYPTVECVNKSESIPSRDFSASKYWYYWLRTPYSTHSYNQLDVGADGTRGCNGAYFHDWGIRPLCNLKNEILISDATDSDGAYGIIWNRIPTTPSSIVVPAVVFGGKGLPVTWGSSTDVDNNLSGYILERSISNGTWIQLYKGINTSCADTITFGWNSIAYRVKAYDSMGAESSYQTSATRSVINNTVPTINGSDSVLGLKTGAFSYNYTVSDIDAGQTITVVEKIDGKQKRSFTAASGTQYTFAVTSAEWLELLNGSHTLTITAADNYDFTTTRTLTFTKQETEIAFQLTTPLVADAMLTKAIMSVTREIPGGAKFTVEGCNNGNDAAPTWEDVTNAVLGGSKFFLANTTKTASKWGFNFRIKVQRNSAIGDCYIQGVGGNFE